MSASLFDITGSYNDKDYYVEGLEKPNCKPLAKSKIGDIIYIYHDGFHTAKVTREIHKFCGTLALSVDKLPTRGTKVILGAFYSNNAKCNTIIADNSAVYSTDYKTLCDYLLDKAKTMVSKAESQLKWEQEKLNKLSKEIEEWHETCCVNN